MELYDWNQNRSKKAASEILNWGNKSDKMVEPPQEYGKAVEILLNEGENVYNLDKYKAEVVKMLGLAWQRPQQPAIPSTVKIKIEAAKPQKKIPKVEKQRERFEKKKKQKIEKEEEIKEVPAEEDKKKDLPCEASIEPSNGNKQRTFWYYP